MRYSNVDLIAMTETWLTVNDTTVLQELIPPGAMCIHQKRVSGLAYRETINIKWTQVKKFAEYCTISYKSFRLQLINRPPYSEPHPVMVKSFVSEFNEYIQCHLLSNIPLLIIGDFNINVDTDKYRCQVLFRSC